jgi:hypothetical protein
VSLAERVRCPAVEAVTTSLQADVSLLARASAATRVLVALEALVSVLARCSASARELAELDADVSVLARGKAEVPVAASLEADTSAADRGSAVTRDTASVVADVSAVDAVNDVPEEAARISATHMLCATDGAVSLIVAGAAAARFMPVRYCAQFADPLVASVNRNVSPLKTSDWPAGIVGPVALVKFDTRPTIRLLAPINEAIVADGAPLAPVLTVVAPVWLATGLAPVMTAMSIDTSKLDVKFAVTVMLPGAVAGTSAIQISAAHEFAASEIFLVYVKCVPRLSVIDVAPLARSALANMTRSSAPPGGLKLLDARLVTEVVEPLAAGVLASIASATPCSRPSCR